MIIKSIQKQMAQPGKRTPKKDGPATNLSSNIFQENKYEPNNKD